LVGVGLILPLDGSSFVRHVGAFQGFISSLSLTNLASGACAGEISQTRIFSAIDWIWAEQIESGSVAAPCQLEISRV